MVKYVAFIRRVPGLEREEFLRQWRELPPLVSVLPGIRSYQQNPAIEAKRPWPWDGMAELWFDDVDALRTAFKSAEFVALREREVQFIGDIEGFIAEEVPVFGTER